MKQEDYEKYKNNRSRSSASELKNLIDTYIEVNNKIRNESSFELDALKKNIKETYQKEIYFTLIDEKAEIVRFNVSERSKNYFIPVFTDIDEFEAGKEKISKLFLDSLDLKVISPLDINKIHENDDNFQGIIINPHNQNFSFDIKSLTLN